MVDEKLYSAALDLLHRKRDLNSLEVVAAAAYLESGEILLGSHFEGTCDAACLCAETGPICEANTRGQKLVASICLLQEKPGGPIIVLAPCGICQERLRVFGPDVQVAVALAHSPTSYKSTSLSTLSTAHWTDALGPLA
jgi:cytidine deaminase